MRIPANGTWTATDSLKTARENHAASLLSNGRVLIAWAARTGTAELSSAELYDPVSKKWTTTDALSWNPTLVESGARGLDEGIDILGREELTVATDAGGIGSFVPLLVFALSREPRGSLAWLPDHGNCLDQFGKKGHDVGESEPLLFHEKLLRDCPL